MTRPVDAVIEFLQSEQSRGKSHVRLDDETVDALRDLHRITSRPRREAAVSVENPVVLPATHRVDSGSGTKQERLSALREQADRWAPARTLGTLRDTMVFSTGNPDARIVLVGEAPGYEEERKKEPFVGPAGQKLNDILKAMGMRREDVYITNIVKFRPSLPRQTTSNRKPSPEEMGACMPFVREEISIIQPECVVALGGTAAEGLLGLAGAVRSMRGAWHAFEGIPTRVTYHPSYLLQSGGSLEVKRQLWEDMMAVMEKLGLPISEKQRGFFLPKA